MSIKSLVSVSTFLLLYSGSCYAMNPDLQPEEISHSPSKMLVREGESETPASSSPSTIKPEEGPLKDDSFSALTIGEASAKEEEVKPSSMDSLTTPKEGMELEESPLASEYPKRPSTLFNEDEGPVSFTWEELKETIKAQKKAAEPDSAEEIMVALDEEEPSTVEPQQPKSREQELHFYLSEFHNFKGGSIPHQKFTFPFDPKRPDRSICQRDLDGALFDYKRKKIKLLKKVQMALGKKITVGSTKKILDQLCDKLGISRDDYLFYTSHEGLKHIKNLLSSFLDKIDEQQARFKEVANALGIDTTPEFKVIGSHFLDIPPDFSERLSKKTPLLKMELEEGIKAKAQLAEMEIKLKEANEAAKKKEEELNTNFATILAEAKKTHEAYVAEEAKKLVASETTAKMLRSQLEAESKKSGDLTAQLDSEKNLAEKLAAQLKAKEKELEDKAAENKRFKDAMDGIEKYIAGLRTGASATP
ncbi:MAG: hypothetical protein JSR85_04790 [Proteobacteria bacterium]|nr:hypothetical protein [Pseudomonadota bacterium]